VASATLVLYIVGWPATPYIFLRFFFFFFFFFNFYFDLNLFFKNNKIMASVLTTLAFMEKILLAVF
jgi:hypothetical protein